jgi:phosphate transport system permease protein
MSVAEREPGGQQPPSQRRPSAAPDLLARSLAGAAAVAIVALLVGFFVALARDSQEAFDTLGWRFLITNDWDPVNGKFGALASVVGTLVSTLIAMLLAVPVGLAVALFLVDFAPSTASAVASVFGVFGARASAAAGSAATWLIGLIGGAIELLAAVPSIIFGMWGLFVFGPFLAEYVEPALRRGCKGVPVLETLFSGPTRGKDMLNAGLMLALMILPFITAVSRDVFRSTPSVLREAAYGMGATTWEVARVVTLRHGWRGVMGASFMALGRALGETMAVAFVIGNSSELSSEYSLFAPATTISATLANQFNETSGELHLSSLVALGLVLLAITVFFQAMAQLWLRWSAARGGTER